jgi:CRISPR-associated protein Cas1
VKRWRCPYQTLNAVLLGPGTSITHDAIRHLSAHGTAIMAVGTDGTRLYTAPPIFDRDSDLGRRQATFWGTAQGRMIVALGMYEKRFGERPRVTTVEALRGMEAARIKAFRGLIARRFGIEWHGRRFDRANPERTDVPNMAINHAVTAVEAAVAIAVNATATIPRLGFIHEDSAKSWVLDICDLYRTTVTVPLAFRAAKEFQRQSSTSLDRLVRRYCSGHFKAHGFVDQVIDDIKEMLP